MGTVYCVNNYVLLSSMRPSQPQHHNFIITTGSASNHPPSPPSFIYTLYHYPNICIFAYIRTLLHPKCTQRPNQPNCSICQTYIHPSSRTDHIFNQCFPRKLCCTPTSHKIAKTNPLQNPTTNRLYPHCNAKTDFLYIFNI